jgi:integrase
MKILRDAAEQQILKPFHTHGGNAMLLSEVEAGEYLVIETRKAGVVHKVALLYSSATEIERFPEHKRRRYVTPAEMSVLATAIDDEPNEFAGHALWLLLLTGLRRNEILAAMWAEWIGTTRRFTSVKSRMGSLCSCR